MCRWHQTDKASPSRSCKAPCVCTRARILDASVTPRWILLSYRALPSAGGINCQTWSEFVLQPPKHHKTHDDPAQLPAGNQSWHRVPTSSHGGQRNPNFPLQTPATRSWESYIDTQRRALGSGMANQWGGAGQEHESPRILGSGQAFGGCLLLCPTFS